MRCGFCVTGFFANVGGDGAIDDAQDFAHDGRFTGRFYLDKQAAKIASGVLLNIPKMEPIKLTRKEILLPGFLIAFMTLPAESADKANLDTRLKAQIASHQLTGTPVPQAKIYDIEHPVAELGKKLFFSKSLSGNFDVACASCHHPLLGGGDALSLPVGIDANDPDLLGPGRFHSPKNALRIEDFGPNVGRHSPTTFNTIFYKQALFHDGRVFLENFAGKETTRTPDSLFGSPDPDAGNTLLEAQSRFPVTSIDEMRGENFETNASSQRVRAHLAGRLGNYGLGKGELGKKNWEQAFRVAFNDHRSPVDNLISFATITQALAAYQSSQVFINSPWRRYVEGDITALSTEQKFGALIFLTPRSEGGAGCEKCHAGDFFTDENYYNIVSPQIGPGKRSDTIDRGRFEISKNPAHKFSFRTPSLLNVTATGPYLHTGAYTKLDEVIRHHANPTAAISAFDFSLNQLPQFSSLGVSYPRSRLATLSALNEAQLPRLNLKEEHIDALVAFMQSLTDPCVVTSTCLESWIHDDQEPDGHILRTRFSSFKDLEVPEIADRKALSSMPSSTPIARRNNFSTTISGIKSNSSPAKPQTGFKEVSSKTGFTYTVSHPEPEKGLDFMTLITYPVPIQMFGGVATGDIDRNGYPDIYITRGSQQGNLLFNNLGGNRFEKNLNSNVASLGRLNGGASIVDIDGDHWLDLVVTGHQDDGIQMLKNEGGIFQDVTHFAGIESTRHSWSTDFGDVDRDGDLDMVVGRWSTIPGEANHLYTNNGNFEFSEGDLTFGYQVAKFNDTDFSFTPNFVDLNQDGWPDLLVAGDFATSQLFINQQGRLDDTTDRTIITDENAMGVAIADYDNDGDPDWFVTSIYDADGPDPDGRWHSSGNRLYQNDDGLLTDVTEIAGVRKGEWGWGACFADFNNDGLPDIFHVNGYGATIGKTFQKLGMAGRVSNYEGYEKFAGTPAHLYLSQGDGTFKDKATEWGIDSRGEGRGIACLDYDRDGDIDIFIANNMQPPELYRNDLQATGESAHIIVSIRDETLNSQGIGAVVTVKTQNKTQTGFMRLGSNFLSHNPTELHFGLGDASIIEELRVSWPTGEADFVARDLQINALYTVRRKKPERAGQMACNIDAKLNAAIDNFNQKYITLQNDTIWSLSNLSERVKLPLLEIKLTKAKESLTSSNPLNAIVKPEFGTTLPTPAASRGVKLLQDYTLSPLYADRADFEQAIFQFLAESASGYVLTHQYLALVWAESLGRLIDNHSAQKAQLLKKIREEQSADRLFSDLYAERAAILLMFGKPSKSEVTEWARITAAAQLPSGGWPELRWHLAFDGETGIGASTQHTDTLGIIVLAEYLNRFGDTMKCKTY